MAIVPATATAKTRATGLAIAGPERGRRMILWGWVATMAGIACYCRAIFTLGPEAEIMDAVMKAGALGWLSALLSIGGIGLWMGGNLIYLMDAVHTPSASTSEAPSEGEDAPR